MNAPVAPPLEFGVTPLQTMATMTGIDFIQAMIAGKLPAPPIMRTMGFTLGKAEKGSVEFQATPSFEHYNPIGSVHGGYFATLLDSAMGCAVHSTLPKGIGYTTLEFKVTLIRPLLKDTGLVRAEGKILNSGRRAATAEGRVTDSNGKLLAHATTTCLVFDLPIRS